MVNFYSSKLSSLVYVALVSLLVVGLPKDINAKTGDQSSVAALEQNTFSVTGRVIDEDGEAVIGATAIVEGTSNGSITDLEGDFFIANVNAGDSISVSFMGYKSQIVRAEQNLVVVLQSESLMMDELVVVGYGVQKKSDLTGAMATMKADDSAISIATSLDQMMQGNLSGVNITNASGMPGGAVSVSIRGIGSINGSNEPLYVIDGIPVSNSDNSAVNSSFGGSVQNPLSMLNPSDIASIDILKDAAAAAIYGSRATNGVVIVTTKRGKKGEKTNVSFNAYYGVQSLPKQIEMASSDLYLEVRNEAINSYNTQYGYVLGDNNYVAPEVNPREGQDDVNWVDLVTYDLATVQNYDISFTGGNEKTRFYSSAGYFDQQGIILTNRFRRISSRTSVDHDISKIFQIGASADLSKTINNRVPNDAVGNGILLRSIEQRPFDTPYKEDGSYMIGGVDIPRHNGVQVLDQQVSKNEWYRAIANTYFTVKPIEGLEYKFNVSADVRYTSDYLKLTEDHPYGSPKGSITDYRSLSQNYLVDNTLTYVKSINKWDLTALAGYSYQEFTEDASYIQGKDFPSSSFDYINAAGYINNAYTTGESNALSSTFVRLNLGYDDRYLLTATMRADGSSKFAEGNRWGTFPSASVAWRISQEDFFSKDSAISDLKLRVSWGMTGNQAGIGSYDSRSLAEGGYNYNGSDGIALTSLANPDLKWEKADQFDVGFDMAFLNNKITVSADYFIKNTRDLLYDRPLQTTSGYSYITQNIGSMRNKGFEFSISSHNIVKKDFRWTTDFNISTTKNKLVSLIDDSPIVSGYSVLQVGEAIGSFYLYEMVGIYQKDSDVPQTLYDQGVRAGDIEYTDVNGDGNITSADKKVVGSATPDFYGGITNRFTYKNFDLSIFNTFSVGGQVYSAGMSAIDAVGYYNYGMRAEVAANRWTGEGTSNTIPRAMISSHNMLSSTYLLRDASYFKFKDVTIGYTLPKSALSKLDVSTFRVYFSAQNLYTISKYPGYDPEVSYQVSDSKTMGVDMMTVPQLRTFSFGVNLNF